MLGLKFSSMALAGLVSSSYGPVHLAADASKFHGTTPLKKLNLPLKKVLRGDPWTETLLRTARQLNRKKNAGRRLEGDEDEDEDEDDKDEDNKDENAVNIDGNYYVKFSQCVDLRTNDEDLFDENLVQYALDGQVTAVKSYVLFHLCETEDDCYYESEDNLYIVDLPTYVQNTAGYFANMKADYCEACNDDNNYNYCVGEDQNDADQAEENGEEDEEKEDQEDQEQEDEKDEEGENKGEEEGENDEEGGEDRKLATMQYQRGLGEKVFIDCDQCADYGCYDNQDDGNGDNNEEAADDWIQGIAECQETGRQFQGIDAYAGLMCTSYGDGIELAMFLNDECTLYTNQLGYSDVYNKNNNNDGDDYLSMAEDFLKRPFEEAIPCRAYEFDNPEDDGGDNENEEVGANDYCKGLVEDGGSVAFQDCEADDAEEDENDEDGDDQYNWYVYEIENDDADDMEAVCQTVTVLDGEYAHVYDENGSGSWYERDRHGNIKSRNKSGSSVGKILWTIFLVLLFAALLGCCCLQLFKKQKRKFGKNSDPIYSDYGPMM